MNNLYNDSIVKKILAGEIGVMPTDTIYGLVCSAMNADAVNRIYKVKNRSVLKPLIVLIGQMSDLQKFDITLTKKEKSIIEDYWPGPVTFVIDCDSEKFLHIHRGVGNIGFRLPKNKELCEFLQKTGPVVAPSANVEGKPPATTIKSANKYFKNKIDFYVDGGKIEGKPSRIFKIIDGELEKIR